MSCLVAFGDCTHVHNLVISISFCWLKSSTVYFIDLLTAEQEIFYNQTADILVNNQLLWTWYNNSLGTGIPQPKQQDWIQGIHSANNTAHGLAWLHNRQNYSLDNCFLCLILQSRNRIVMDVNWTICCLLVLELVRMYLLYALNDYQNWIFFQEVFFYIFYFFLLFLSLFTMINAH